MKLYIRESNQNILHEKSNFDDIEKAVKYYYNKWYYSDMSYDDIASDLKRLGHNDDFIDAVLDGISERYEDDEDYELDDYDECLTEDSLDDIVRPEIKKRYIWPLYVDANYEIAEIIEKYQNTNRFKNEIKSFDLKEISYMDYSALQLEIECSYEAYALIKKDIERAGLYIDDEDYELDEHFSKRYDRIIKEEKYDLSWKENDVRLNIDGEIGTYPSYSKRVGNVVVNIDPEVFSNGEFGYTVYYTTHIGQSGFKKAESGFMNSSEAMDYADTYIFDAENLFNSFKDNQFEAVEIDVKHEGILEVPEGKNVDDLPFSHFEKLAKKNGLSKITKALNNLQVWNKNDDKKLSKWAGDMIDKLNKKLDKKESLLRLNEKDNFNGSIISAADYYYPRWKSEVMDSSQIRDELVRKFGHSEDFADEVLELIFDKYDDDQRYWDEYDESLIHNKLKKDESLFREVFDEEDIKENNIGGRDFSYLDPVLQEFLDWLEQENIYVVNVRPKMKAIDVRAEDLEMATWYLRDRDYFGREPFLKDWIITARA